MDFTRASGRPKAGAGVILTPRPLSGLPLHPILRHVCSWGPLQPFPPVSIPEERGEAVLEGARDPQTGPAAPGGRGEGLSPAAARRPPPRPQNRGSPLLRPDGGRSGLPMPIRPQLFGSGVTGGEGSYRGGGSRSQAWVEGGGSCGGHFSGTPFAGRAIGSRKRGAHKVQPGSSNLRGWQQPFPPRRNRDFCLFWGTRVPRKSARDSSLPLDAC